MFSSVVSLTKYPDNCPPRKIAPRLGFGFGSRLGLVLGLSGNQTSVPRKIVPLLWLRVSVRVSFGLGAVFLGGVVPEPFYNYQGKLKSLIMKKMFIEIGFKVVWIFKRFLLSICFRLSLDNYKEQLWSFMANKMFIEIRFLDQIILELTTKVQVKNFLYVF